MPQEKEVLFCGKTMQAAYALTQQLAVSGTIAGSEHLRVVCCESKDVNREMRDTHIAVPLMSQLNRATIAQAPNLKMILQFGVGVEGIDIPAATEHGVMVSNIPSRTTGNALACAEHALLLTLALLRDWNECQAALQARRLGEPCGDTLHGKRVLILGFGNIAKELVVRLNVFGVRMACVRRSAWDDAAHSPEDRSLAELLDEKGCESDLPAMLPAADIIIVTAAQTADSRNLVNREFLSHCKKGVRLVNVARGGLLEYDAILEGLRSQHIGGLGLDVHWTEPFDPTDPVALHPRVILTPHVAGVTKLSYGNMAKVILEEALRVQQGGAPVICLNTV